MQVRTIPKPVVEKEVFERFQHLLEEFLIEYAYADLFADALGVSQKQLNTISLQLSGKTACQLVEQKIVEKAKGLLLETALPVKEISWQLGYEDHYYFSRMFKKQTGHPPRRWRIEYREK
jgi:AraC-like DNA-binding protein